jgi:hypothetical protein
MDALQDPKKIFITAFSRGSTDVYHGVKELPQIQKDRLMITALGPIMILPRDLGYHVMNLVSDGDWCSKFCNPGLKRNLAKYREYADVNILPQRDGFTGVIRDHFFLSKTYQAGIKRYTRPLYEEYGGLE